MTGPRIRARPARAVQKAVAVECWKGSEWFGSGLQYKGGNQRRIQRMVVIPASQFSKASEDSVLCGAPWGRFLCTRETESTERSIH